MNDVEFLKAARALVERGWTQGAFARLLDGREVPPGTEGACEFCALGAIYHLEKTTQPEVSCLNQSFYRAFRALHPEHTQIARFNDLETTKKEDILEIYDEAIRRAENADKG